MAITTPGSMSGNNVTIAREDIDAADADYSGDTLADAIDCAGLARLLVVAKCTSGSGSITVQPCMVSVLARDTNGAPTSTLLFKGENVTLGDGDMLILDVGGRAHSLHVVDVTGGGTWSLYAGVWEALLPATCRRD